MGLEIRVKLSDGSTIDISASGDIYQNLADTLGISRYAAKTILLQVLYGKHSDKVEVSNG